MVVKEKGRRGGRGKKEKGEKEGVSNYNLRVTNAWSSWLNLCWIEVNDVTLENNFSRPTVRKNILKLVMKI